MWDCQWGRSQERGKAGHCLLHRLKRAISTSSLHIPQPPESWFRQSGQHILCLPHVQRVYVNTHWSSIDAFERLIWFLWTFWFVSRHTKNNFTSHPANEHNHKSKWSMAFHHQGRRLLGRSHQTQVEYDWEDIFVIFSPVEEGLNNSRSAFWIQPLFSATTSSTFIHSKCRNTR